MDIEKLQNKRQLNVQEQNALLKDGILNQARHWRVVGVPVGLAKALKEKGINLDKAILLNYEQDFPGCSTDEGLVVTDQGKFFEFEMDLTPDRASLIEFYVWDEVTENTEINPHKPGTGATWGYLALEVLSELNKC